jgi:hypothetical protein
MQPGSRGVPRVCCYESVRWAGVGEINQDRGGELIKTPSIVHNVLTVHIWQIGCGTAIPTMYLLHELFSHPWKKETPAHEGGPLETTIYLQDFNSLVVELVTFPNILLTWCKCLKVFRVVTATLLMLDLYTCRHIPFGKRISQSQPT